MKTIVNIDKIQKIHVYDAKPTGLKHFVKGVEEKRILFGLIRIQRKQDSRWKDYNYSYSSREDLIKNNESLYIKYSNPFKSSIWIKPSICIVMPYGASDERVYFDSDAERNSAVNELMKKSNNKLVVVKK
jgi:hypothetical protein